MKAELKLTLEQELNLPDGKKSRTTTVYATDAMSMTSRADPDTFQKAFKGMVGDSLWSFINNLFAKLAEHQAAAIAKAAETTKKKTQAETKKDKKEPAAEDEKPKESK